MNQKTILICTILVLILNFSCVEKKSAGKEAQESGLTTISAFNSLKFTSGIRAIFQDSKGDYWIGSHREGICRYHGKTFEYFTMNEGLSDNQIRSFEEDEDGNIWIATGNGVSKFNGEKFTTFTTEMNPEPSDWKTATGSLWFHAGTNQGIYRYDGMQMNYLAFPDPKETGYGNLYAVTSLSKGKNNMLWMGTYAGVFGYDGSDFTIINDQSLGLENSNNGVHVRSILEDSKGRLWIGNNGIGVMLKSGDSIIHFSKEKGLLLPMNEFEANFRTNQKDRNTGLQSVFAIAEDHDGNIWFGDRDSGAWKYDGKTLTNYKIDTSLSAQMIWCIYEDHNKNLLFGMAEGGVYQFNGKTFDKRF